MFLLSKSSRRIACAVLLTVLALLPAAAARVVAQESPLIRFGTGPDDQSTPLLYAAKAGIYKKYGLNVEMVKMGGAAEVAAALSGGSLEMGKASSLGAITAIAKGLPFTVIGNLAYYDAAKPDIALLVLADSPIKSAKDLEGKTLAAVSLSDMNSVATFAWLDSQGVDRGTLKYVEFPASASLAAMQQNRIVASTIYEPYFSSYMSSGKVRVLGYPFGAIAKHFSDALIFTTTKWAAEHPNEVKKFLAATEEASTYIAAHENLSSQLIAEFGDVDPATIANIHHAGRGIALSTSDVQLVIDTAYKYKIIPNQIRAADIICSCALMKK